MTSPSIWVMSDGRAGIERQAVSLSRALQASPAWTSLTGFRGGGKRSSPLRLAPRGWQVNLPPTLWPSPLSLLSSDERDLLRPPWPDLLIGNGRRSIAYALHVKRRSRGRTMLVQIQHPKVAVNKFDLVIPPEHDALTGPNVFPILGPPVWWGEDEINAAASRFPDLRTDPGRKVMVAIGGDSRTHRLTPAALSRISDALRAAHAQGATLWVTVSRRTSPDARASLRKLSGELNARFWENEQRDGPNPYLAFLALSDAAMVTEDSANMLAEPALFGRPTHVLKLEGGSPRFERLHAGFIARRSARWWTGKLDDWSYTPIREAERAALEVARRLGERQRAA